MTKIGLKIPELGDTIELFNGNKPKLTVKIIGISSVKGTAYLVTDFSHYEFYDRLDNSTFLLKEVSINLWLESKYEDEYVANIEDYYDKKITWVFESNDKLIPI